ncbi:sodium-dependent neutral amino acid transporter B(0)AT1-like isoform X2 [Atheta coriaria]|uniref:sodium-dependent neutral amino acid transporter B(0)AT1-like isoform X2 n=1 Tax=Dalotia coriaria TaxID=877792 RepID=UPI0031F3442B
MGKESEEVESIDVPEAEEGDKWLTTSEFIFVNLSRHYSIENYSLYKYENPSEALNIFQVLIAYLIVGIPIGYMEIVLGQYTNMGVFHIKHLMPIAQGMSYTFILQVLATTTLSTILMTQYLNYAMIIGARSLHGQGLPWLECPKNYSDICYNPQSPCEGDEPCINETRHLSTKIYMKGICAPEDADLGLLPIHRAFPLMMTWTIVWWTMTLNFTRTKKLIKNAFLIVIGYRLVQFAVLVFWLKYILYLPRMIELHMGSLVNLEAWKQAILKVTVGMGLGDFSYIMFGILSKRTRKTGGLMWFCGFASFFLTVMDHIVISGGTYWLCEVAKLPVEKRYLLFRPENIQHELGVMPVLYTQTLATNCFNYLYFLHRFMVLLFHAMLNYSFLQLSMYQKYPGLEIYGVYIKPLFCFFGFGVSLLLDSKEAYAFRFDIQRVILEFCDQFNIIIITVIVFYIYGVSKFCDDVHFMTGQEPAKFWSFVWVISPLVVIICLPVYLFDSTYIFYTYRLITLGVFYSPYMIFLTITVVQKIYQKRLLTLLRSTDEWGPLDPQLKLYRKCFNPRTDSKRKNMSYKCVHRCLIDEVHPSSEEEDEGTFI